MKQLKDVQGLEFVEPVLSLGDPGFGKWQSEYAVTIIGAELSDVDQVRAAIKFMRITGAAVDKAPDVAAIIVSNAQNLVDRIIGKQ